MEKLNSNNIGFYLLNYDSLGYMVAMGLYYEGVGKVLDIYGTQKYLSDNEVRTLEKLRENKPQSCEKIILSKVLNVFLGDVDDFVRDFDFGFNKIFLENLYEMEIINIKEFKSFSKRDLVAFKAFLMTVKENLDRINSGCSFCTHCRNIRRISSKNTTSVHWQDWSDFCQSDWYFKDYMDVPNICLREFAKDYNCKSIDEFLGSINHRNR